MSLTLEMPFKDNANLPDERVGWNGERSAALGASMLRLSCDTCRRSEADERSGVSAAERN
ncbi:MAG: Predicted carboxypeptidase [uncultured Caballeronia sp.]|nr:MAG: Predicted carboxypeptidase [uncultured Caballeronia sp.]